VRRRWRKPVTTWFLAFYLNRSGQKRDLLLELSRHVGVNDDTAWLRIKKIQAGP